MYKKWKGTYEYDKCKHQEATGSDRTNFEVEIISISGSNFVGKIVDDVNSGGTAGIGEVAGRISGNEIEFVKKMPVLTRFEKGKIVPVKNKKGRNIFYSGILSDDGKSASGRWRFKIGVGFLGILPVIFLPTSGVWTMSAVE